MSPPVACLGRLVAAFDKRAEAIVGRLRHRRWADLVFYSASAAGELSLLWIALALLRGRRGGPQDVTAARRTVVAAVLESLAVNGALKSLVGRERPVDPVAHPLPFRQPLTSSFPSGHATAAFCAATLLAESEPTAPLYYALATVVATSRAYVRIHHASDVLGGAAIGLLLGRLGRRLAPLERQATRGRSTMRPVPDRARR